MRYVSMFIVIAIVFIFALSLAAIAAAEPLTPRPLDSLAADAFARARDRSSSVRILVATLESSNVIVHIESSRTLPAGIVGMTRFATSRGGYRYVRITLAVDLSAPERAVILGHELQHAVEVAMSTADDIESVRRLFEEKGHMTGAFFDTRAAIRVEHMVRRELLLQAEPVIKFHH